MTGGFARKLNTRETETQRAEGIGALIQGLRLSRQMSLRGLARAAGISPGTLCHWETGQAAPRIPELDAVLDVLGAPVNVRQEAYARINAPRGLARLRHCVRLTEREADLEGWLPSSGDLLRALRHRHGLSLEQAAAALRVQPSTLSRWERAITLPSAESLATYCALLGVSAEERAALTNLCLSAQNANGTPLPIEALAAQLEQLQQDTQRGAQTLMDLRFLSLEAQLWPRAAQKLSARQLFAKTRVWRAQWLQWQGRLSEAGPLAQQALRLVEGETPQRFWFRAVHIAAHHLSDGGRQPNPTRSIRFLQEWLSAARWPETESWTWHNLANYFRRLGDMDAALLAVAQAQTAAQRSELAAAIRNSSFDSAVVLLEADRIDAALALLTETEQPNVYHRRYEAHAWARTLQAIGETEAAAVWQQRAWETVQARDLPCASLLRFPESS
jgi:transcriptional regulator with XRE-family HTH domain